MSKSSLQLTESDYDNVAVALVIQQPRVHLQESRMRPKENGKDTRRLEVKHRTMERVLASQI